MSLATSTPITTAHTAADAASPARKERTLLDKVVERSWQSVMDNLKTYKSMFGSNFVEVSTEGKETDNLPPGVRSGINKFLSKPPKNKIAVKWLKHARELL